MVIAGTVTVNAPIDVAWDRSGFVTVTSRAVVAASSSIVIVASTRTAETQVVELTVMPVPENVTSAPLRSHWYANACGAPFHAPVSEVNSWPMTTLPVIAGRIVLAGGASSVMLTRWEETGG